MTVPLPDPERGRRIAGTVLFVVGNIVGMMLLVVVFGVLPLLDPNASVHYDAMGIGALLAFPAVAVYVTLPRLLDRYDPEPWWALAMVFAWGALAACGVSATVNTLVGLVAGEGSGASPGALSSVVSAPLVEELTKGAAVFGVYYFLRREFDGIVDGIIYATFAALGFAAVENVVYYARAELTPGGSMLGASFVLRGVLTPWAHPLFTSMTGLGFGLARETTRPWVRAVAPLAGYAAAVLLHACWNGAAVVSAATQTPLVLVLLPLWFLVVVAFFGIVVALVLRRGRIIRAHLLDEVALGVLSPAELELVCSPFGQLQAALSPGGTRAREFVATASRLALSKWHTARAYAGQTRTLSFGFIQPLRQRLAELRREIHQGARPPPRYPPQYPPQYPPRR